MVKKHKTNVLFVCLGNICRSPSAEIIFSQLVKERGLEKTISVDSCGTGSWHIGQGPDERAQSALKKHGLDMSHLRARRLKSEDFQTFDYILAMDARNLADILKLVPSDYPGRVQLLMDYAQDKTVPEVPDPYYGGADGFERVIIMLKSACEGLLDAIVADD